MTYEEARKAYEAALQVDRNNHTPANSAAHFAAARAFLDAAKNRTSK